jgi:hypothetical protein
MFCVYLRTNRDCATYIINRMGFINEMKSVYSAVRTGSLNKAVCVSSFKGSVGLYSFFVRTCRLACDVKWRLKIECLSTSQCVLKLTLRRKLNSGVLICSKLQCHVWLQAYRKKRLPSSEVYFYFEYENLHCPPKRKSARYLTLPYPKRP